MSRRKNVIPAIRYRKRKTVTEARVWFDDRWHHVGFVGEDPAELRARVMAIVDRVPPPPKPLPDPEGLTILKLFATFLKSGPAPADKRDWAAIKRAGELLSQFSGDAPPAAGLTAQAFADWRDWLCRQPAMVYRGKRQGSVRTTTPKVLSAEYITRLMAHVRRVYRWAGQRRLVPPGIAADLANTARLTPGRARRSEAPKPVRPADVRKVLKHLPPVVRVMVRIQRATAARPCEIWRMRPREVHRGGVVAVGKSLVDLKKQAGGAWLYIPDEHKTDGHGHVRTIPIPPSVQAALKPFLNRGPDDYCFSPAVQETMRKDESRPARRSKATHFTTQTYTKEIQRACRRAGVEVWTGYQVRHLGIFEVAAAKGARAAQLFAGHADLKTTSRYLDFDAKTLFAAAKGR